MCIQHTDQISWTSMERETEMADLSLCFFLHRPLEAVQFLIGFPVPSVFNGMEQIKIEIIHPAAPQLLIKNAVSVIGSFQAPGSLVAR